MHGFYRYGAPHGGRTVLRYEIQVAQHKAYMKKEVYLVAQRQKLVAWGTRTPLKHSPADKS